MGRWDYPKSRRILMQAALCCVLAATVGLAQMVVRHRQKEPAGHQSNRIWVTVPRGWTVIDQGATPGMFEIQEPDSPAHHGRMLTAVKSRPRVPTDTADFMQALLTSASDDHPDIIPTPIEEVNLGEYPGLLVSLHWLAEKQSEWIACSVHPDGTAIVLLLDCPAGTSIVENRRLMLSAVASVRGNP